MKRKEWAALATLFARERTGSIYGAYADIDLARSLYGDEKARKGIYRLCTENVSWNTVFANAIRQE